MADQIYLPVDLAEGKDVILVGGQCYERVGPANKQPDTFSVQNEFTSCYSCQSSEIQTACCSSPISRILNATEGGNSATTGPYFGFVDLPVEYDPVEDAWIWQGYQTAILGLPWSIGGPGWVPGQQRWVHLKVWCAAGNVQLTGRMSVYVDDSLNQVCAVIANNLNELCEGDPCDAIFGNARIVPSYKMSAEFCRS